MTRKIEVRVIDDCTYCKHCGYRDPSWEKNDFTQICAMTGERISWSEDKDGMHVYYRKPGILESCPLPRHEGEK